MTTDDCPARNCRRPDEAAEQAVRRVFEILGVDIHDPRQVKRFQRGIWYGSEMMDLAKHGRLAMLTSLISLMTAAVWYAFWGAK